VAIATTRRRPFSFRGRDFVWDANDEWHIRIASKDKLFAIRVPIVWPPFPPHSDWPAHAIPIYVAGPQFPGLDGKKDIWLVCRTISKFELGSTPGSVRKLLDWTFSDDKQIEILHPLPPDSTGAA
jgi:hypothetical protein